MYVFNYFKTENWLKTLIGWSGLFYFFFTDNQTWGEAVGLTLFFASGQLQTAMQPPLEGYLSKIIPAEHLLEAWRITLGLASCLYYSYFELYLCVGLNFYISTVCLSLLWESRIVDDLINFMSIWVSRDFTVRFKIWTKTISKLTFDKCKNFITNIIQDFLCVLCKLFKHLVMNFNQISNLSLIITTAKSVAKEYVNLPGKMLKQESSLKERVTKKGEQKIRNDYMFVRVSMSTQRCAKSAYKQKMMRHTRKETVF